MKWHLPKAVNRFMSDTPWQSKAHRAWFILCSVCLAIYTAYITFFAYSGFLNSRMETVAALLWFILLAITLFCGFLWCLKRWGNCAPRACTQRQSLDPRLFVLSSAVAFCILLATFMKYYPGGVSYDAANQWMQAQTGEFNNWHPVFHTLLIWLVTKVHNTYAFVVLVQLTCFSLALGYAAATLGRYGVPAWLTVSVSALVTLSEPVRNTLMYVWKDNAMTIGCLILFTHCVHLLNTKGGWLSRPLNAVSFGLALAFTTMTRHNAVLFTLPLLLLTLGCYGVRKHLPAVATCLVSLLLVQGALFGALDIVYPDNTVEEAVGIPMMILGNCKQQSPDSLDEETQAFLNTLATDDAWRTVYRRSDYNAIKFTFPRELIKNRPVTDILSMAVRTASRAPRLAFETINEATGLVWDVTGKNQGYETVTNSGDLPNAGYSNTWINAAGKAICALLDAPMNLWPLSWLMRNIGVQQLLLLLVTLWALYRLGVKALIPALPILIYNLATMLLLCGQDARFFQFAMVLSIPSMLALIYAPMNKEM